MDIKIPEALRIEHEELHVELSALSEAPGGVGAAAREVARLLHPHFVKEEEYALPPLGLLATVAQGTVTPAMRAALVMTDRLKEELPEMLAEHRLVVAALENHAEAGKADARQPCRDASIQTIQAVQPAVEREVLGSGEVAVQIGLVRHDAQAAPRCRRVAESVQPEQRESSGRGTHQRRQHLE